MPIALGVNIDHVATLRNARGIGFPDPVTAAQTCLDAGADLIVMHLRQDRRHIQDEDLARMRKKLRGHIHLEMACVPEMERLALKYRPDSVCLVPEHPRELTTQGGLDLSGKNAARIGRTVSRLIGAGIGVSLFVDPSAEALRLSRKIGADTVELCTRDYAEATGRRAQSQELEKLEISGQLARELELALHAGHGLEYHNVAPVAGIEGMECLNIGFSIMARAMFVGLDGAVREMLKLI